MKTAILLLGAAVLPAVVGCSTTTDCAGVGAPDVSVTVVDSLTGASAAIGATLLTYDLDAAGALVDSVTGGVDGAPLRGEIDRRGRFRVVVRKDGYRDWTKAEVEVTNGCPAIHTAQLTARLVADSPPSLVR